MTFVNFWLDLAVRPPFLPLLGRRGGRGLRRIIFCCVALTAAAADDDASNVASDASRVASCFLLSDDTVSGGLRVRCCWRLCVGADALPPLVDWDDCEALPFGLGIEGRSGTMLGAVMVSEGSPAALSLELGAISFANLYFRCRLLPCTDTLPPLGSCT